MGCCAAKREVLGRPKQGISPNTNSLTIIWLEENLESTNCQEHLSKLSAHPRIYKIKPCKTIEEVKEILECEYINIDLAIVSGIFGKELTKLISNYTNKPIIEVIIFSGNIEYHKKWGSTENSIRMVTQDLQEILHFFNYFQRKGRLKGLNESEYIFPYEGEKNKKNIETYVALRFLHYLFFIRGFKYEDVEIIDNLKKAGGRSAPKDTSDGINNTNTNKYIEKYKVKIKKLYYTKNEIDFSIKKLEKYITNVDVLNGYNTLESYIYTETNRRLYKYLHKIPIEAYDRTNLQFIRNGKYINKYFQKLNSIIPFAINLLSEIVKYNSENPLINKKISGTTVYRAINLTSEQFIHLLVMKGRIIGFPSFIYTSLKISEARKFGDVVMAIYIPEFKDYQGYIFPINMSYFTGSEADLLREEVLLPPATHLKVMGYSTDPYKVIYLRYIPQVIFSAPNLNDPGEAFRRPDVMNSYTPK